MPVNKNQLGRFLVIHECLSTGRSFTWAQLAEACQYHDFVREMPSQRTLIDDINELRETFGAPIPRRKSAYYYEKPFSLYDILNTEDSTLVKEAMLLLRQMSSLGVLKGFEDVWLKLQQRTGVVGSIPAPMVHFDIQAPSYTGNQWLPQLYETLKAGRIVWVHYRSFDGQTSRYQFNPYFLKQYNHRWYLFGCEVTDTELLNLALDRIESLTPTERLAKTWDTDPHQYFLPMLGVTRMQSRDVETIQFRLYGKRAMYAQTKTLHQSQRTISETSAYTEFAIDVIINPETEAALWEFGSDLEVLQPLWLRQEFAEKVKKMWERYGD